MSKVLRSITTLCMLSILLLPMLSFTTARPIPTFKDVTPVETHHAGEDVGNANMFENCTGPGEEECLLRKTVAAHLDYIYTQRKQP